MAHVRPHFGPDGYCQCLCPACVRMASWECVCLGCAHQRA